MNHQTIRQQLWCNIAAAAVGGSTSLGRTPTEQADHILKAFDARFPEPPVKAEPPAPEIPAGLPPLPPVPEGYDRWVYRGTHWKTDRTPVVYALANYIRPSIWLVELNDSPWGSSDHYIEAVKGGDQ